MVDSDLSKKNSGLMIGGIIALLAGFFLGGIGLFVSRGLLVIGVLAIFAGLAIIGYALSTGLKVNLSSNVDKPEERHDNAYIMTKLVVDRKGEHVFDPDMHDEETLQYLVQVEFADGRKTELNTSEIVFDSMGEGQRGTVVLQGRWMNQFIFVPDAVRPDERTYEEPYRPGL